MLPVSKPWPTAVLLTKTQNSTDGRPEHSRALPIKRGTAQLAPKHTCKRQGDGEILQAEPLQKRWVVSWQHAAVVGRGPRAAGKQGRGAKTQTTWVNGRGSCWAGARTSRACDHQTQPTSVQDHTALVCHPTWQLPPPQ